MTHCHTPRNTKVTANGDIAAYGDITIYLCRFNRTHNNLYLKSVIGRPVPRNAIAGKPTENL